jgi:hypothetical protein
VINQFTAIGKDPRTTFYGNVTLGRDVSLAELRAMYDAVRACGAATVHTMQCGSNGGGEGKEQVHLQRSEVIGALIAAAWLLP